MKKQESLSNGKVGIRCNKCHGSGHILYEDENGCSVARECTCRRKIIADNKIRFANIPEAFKDMFLNNFNLGVYKQQDSKSKIMLACKIVKRYLAEFEIHRADGMGLYIHSETKGSGKTRMAASVANELIRTYLYKTEKVTVKFATSTAILEEIKSTWSKDKEYSESSLLDALILVDVLVIDDFGTEVYKDWIGEKFYHIINERYIDKKVTIFTSNYSLDNLKYNDRITNRIKERTFQIAFPEESIREQIAEANKKKILEAVM